MRLLPAVVALAAILTGCGVDSAPSTPPPSTIAAIEPVAVAPAPATLTRALDVLGTLPVKGRAPRTGYDRDQFGPAWTDDNPAPLGHNGCSTRDDILARDLTAETLRGRCVVLTGTLDDPYTGKVIAFTRGNGTSDDVQIDHRVALADAWEKGAQALDPRERRQLSNDPLNLQATDGSTNMRKGAGDAATWLPPARGYRCTYVAYQIAVKAKYRLWITPAERDAMAGVLSTCPNEPVPSG